MTDPFVRSLVGDASRPELRVERRYPGSPEQVWSALTTPERLARWLGVVEGAPRRVGDAFTVTFPDAPEEPARGRVSACIPRRLIVLEWHWGGEARSTVTVALDAVDGGCRVTLTHRLGEPDHVADYGGGWEWCLQRLAAGRRGDDGGGFDERAARARWRDMSAHAFTIDVALDAPPADVWQALTTVDGLRSWWWDHWRDVEITVDAQEGHGYRFAAPGAGIAVSGRFLAVEPMRRLAYTWRWEDADGISRDEACDVVLRERDGGGCRLTLRHTGPWVDDGPARSYRQGWESTLGRLVAALATR